MWAGVARVVRQCQRKQERNREDAQKNDGGGAPRSLAEAVSESQYAVFTLLVLSYTPVVRQAMAVFKCVRTSAGADAVSVLTADMSMVCYEPEHNTLMAVGALQLVVYGLGIPMGIAYLLWRAKRGNPDGLDNEKTKAALGFVYEGYSRNCYAWECLIMLRKAVLAMVVTACKDSPFYQTFFAAMLLQAYTYVHLQFRPYRDKVEKDANGLMSTQKLVRSACTHNITRAAILTASDALISLRSREKGRLP